MSEPIFTSGLAPAQNAFGLDLTRYLDEISDVEVSEQQKLEFLYLLATMMEAFVRQGIDVGICGQLLEAFNQCSTPSPAALPSISQLETKDRSTLRDGGSIEE